MVHGPFMEPCGGPSIATPLFFVFEASNGPWKLETEKTATVTYRVENTHVQYLVYRNDNPYFM